MIKSAQAEDASQAEGMQAIATRAEQGDRLLEKWGRNDIGKDLVSVYAQSKNKARYGAMMLEAQERHMRQMAMRLSETAISSSFQTTPENVLKIIKIGVANAIRGDLFTEVALQTPDDAIYYLERKLETTFANRGTAGNIINENVNPYYPAEQLPVAGTSTGSTITIQVPNSSPSYIPIRAGKTVITYKGQFVGLDNGANAFTAYSTASGPQFTSGTVDYTLGTITATFNTSVTGSDVVAIVTWDSENSANYTNYGTVTLTTRKQRFAARPQPLGYAYTQMTEVLLGSTMGINTEAELIEAVGLEHALAKDYRAIAAAVAVANGQTPYTYDANFAAYGEVSENAHAQNLLSKIDLIGGAVYNDKKRGMINKAVAGTNMLTYMRKHKLWEENKGAVKEGPYKAGTLAGIEVFACPVDATNGTQIGLTVNDAILMYKNPREGLDISLAIGTLVELSAKLVYPTMNVVGNVAAVESVLVMNTSFAKKLSLTNYNLVA